MNTIYGYLLQVTNVRLLPLDSQDIEYVEFFRKALGFRTGNTREKS